MAILIKYILIDLVDTITIHKYNNRLKSVMLKWLEFNNVSNPLEIYNNNGFKYIYIVFEKYEVKENNLSPIYNYNKNEKTLTLITCNNLNNNRIIIKAKQNKE